jgi:transposase InsO family protein
LLGEVRAIHSASDGNYGSPRVYEELRAQGNVVSLNRVRRLMNKHGIAAATSGRFATTDWRALQATVRRIGSAALWAERPDQVWLTDVTYL